jgi:hypothetical protein
MVKKYQWQGEPVKVIFGYCLVKENKEKPMWWYNYECRQDGTAVIPALQITTQNDHSFFISNHYGIGVHKLINGGWPGCTHFSLNGGEFTGRHTLMYTVFDLDGYEKHEANRRIWQKENHPEEYEKQQKLIDSFRMFTGKRIFTLID